MNDTGRERAKQAAAEAAAALVENGMVLGLGSGSTATLFLEALARRNLRVRGVATSRRTEAAARRLGIELVELSAATKIDLAIDGADEIERRTLSLIKGRGGALLREKIVASAASHFIVIADDEKPVERLGHHMPVPVEVVAFGHERTALRLGELGTKPTLRRDFVSDGGNVIYDCAGLGPIADAAALEGRIKSITGVIDCGLFIGLASEALVGDASGAVLRLTPR